MKTYRIEEISRELGLTKRTIRYYEEIGLLHPPDRSEGGYRQYTDQHIDRLRNIIDARDVLGISLQEILSFVTLSEEVLRQRQDMIHTEDRREKLEQIAQLETTIQQQRQFIEQKLAKLTYFRDSIEDLQQKLTEAKRKYEA